MPGNNATIPALEAEPPTGLGPELAFHSGHAAFYPLTRLTVGGPRKDYQTLLHESAHGTTFNPRIRFTLTETIRLMAGIHAMVALVERILKAKRADAAAETAGLEREIDERVYRPCGLTAEEIKIAEEAGK